MSSSLEPRKIENLCKKRVVDIAFGSGPHVLSITEGSFIKLVWILKFMTYIFLPQRFSCLDTMRVFSFRWYNVQLGTQWLLSVRQWMHNTVNGASAGHGQSVQQAHYSSGMWQSPFCCADRRRWGICMGSEQLRTSGLWYNNKSTNPT